MADSPDKSRPSFFKRVAARLGLSSQVLDEIDQADAYFGTQAFNGGYATTALQGEGNTRTRPRLTIYQKYVSMVSDPIVSSALRLHCTAALGGDQSTGDVVFIERTPETEKNEAMSQLVDDVRDELAPLMNRIAYTVAFNSVSFGDGYARIYAKPGVGIQDAYVEEMVMPPLVQAYEKGGKTVGFVAYVGRKMREKLTPAQMIRMKMPRTIYVAQPLAVEKAWRMMIAEDDIEKLPVMPAIAGGSFLEGTEEAYDRYLASILSLLGKRAKDSLDAAWLKVNVAGMTKENQIALIDSIKNFQKYLQDVQRAAIATKSPVLESLRGLLPVSDEQQVTAIETTGNGDSQQGYTVEDVMMNARLLAGALGIDLSMLGFADQMSGGLGEGGWFRLSALAAEKSRMIRVALAEFFNLMVEIHLLYSRKLTFAPKDRPWKINFYGAIAALETEQQKTTDSEIAAGAGLAGALQQLRDLGLSRKSNKYILGKRMGFDDDAAEMLARDLEKAAQNQEPPPLPRTRQQGEEVDAAEAD